MLPDANVLQGVTDGFVGTSATLLKDAKAWKATPEDAFTALVVMIPAMDLGIEAADQSARNGSEKGLTEAKAVVMCNRML
ncbi:hypothetical protein [Paenibacillus sp. yr247]|uniref:hypothetical protein n=1 Tax=Paenibacillus sp. yr247 TaxID=1761880 RepID=UPI0015877654|nr:hypothetical protein [Paenibacillus sp. yr247]